MGLQRLAQGVLFSFQHTFSSQTVEERHAIEGSKETLNPDPHGDGVLSFLQDM